MVAGVHREAVDRADSERSSGAPFREPAAEVVAVDILFEHDREQMMRGRVAGAGRRRAARDAVERGAIRGIQLASTPVLRIQPVEPPHPERGSRLVEPVVVTERHHVVTRGVAPVPVPRERGHAMGAQEPDACGELLVGGGDHPAFADRQVLVREEAERGGEPEAADLTAVDAGPERVCGILKKKEVALLRQPRDGSRARRHVRRSPCGESRASPARSPPHTHGTTSRARTGPRCRRGPASRRRSAPR